MAKHTKKPLLLWLSEHTDGKEERFIQVGNSFMLSKKVQKLSTGALWLYFSLCMESGGKSSTKLSHSAARKYGIAKSSFDRHIKELEAAGFIKRQEKDIQWQYETNTYQFTPAKWKSRTPF